MITCEALPRESGEPSGPHVIQPGLRRSAKQSEALANELARSRCLTTASDLALDEARQLASNADIHGRIALSCDQKDRALAKIVNTSAPVGAWSRFLDGRLRIPVIGSPLFLVSNPALVIAQCTAGIVGSFPALNARPASQLDEWLHEIREALAAHDARHPDRPAAPLAVNQIVHRSNGRLEQDLQICERHKVPIVITSLGARPELNQAVHDWGGVTLHDIINQTFARKAIEKGADGLIAVAAGAGGHAGSISPFALMAEIREWFDGPVALSGAIATGRGVRAAELMGADVAYIGSAFIATQEANAGQRYKQMIVDSAADDIVNSDVFTGVHGNYLAPSIVAAGMDPAKLGDVEAVKMDFGAGRDEARDKKAWRDIWGSGQGIGSVKEIVPAAELVERLAREYAEACGAAPRLGLRVGDAFATGRAA